MTEDEEEGPPEYTASLRIWSETLSVSEMTDRLGNPTRSYERREPKTRRYPDGAKQEGSGWTLDSEVDREKRLNEHVEALLAFLDARSEEVERMRNACEIDIFCGVFHNDDINCSFVFEPDLSRRLAEWELPIVVCCYWGRSGAA